MFRDGVFTPGSGAASAQVTVESAARAASAARRLIGPTLVLSRPADNPCVDLLRPLVTLLRKPRVLLEQPLLTFREVLRVVRGGVRVQLVAGRLTRLREEDQRGGVRGLGGEGEVQEDERVGIPPELQPD